MREKKSRTRYQLTMKAYSYMLVLAMIATIIATPLGGVGLWVSANEEELCEHEHSEECYAAPEGHECSEDEGCVPTYPMKTVVAGEPHEHDDGCYGVTIVTAYHAHDGACFDEEGELACGLSETDEVTAPNYDDLTCTQTEETIEVPDYDAVPISWACNAEPNLICSHTNCTQGQECLRGGY